MADDINYKSDAFYTKGMKPAPDEGVNALWARMIASNTGAAHYFRTVFVDNEQIANAATVDLDTGYDWSSRWALIFAIQDASSISADNWARVSGHTYLNTSASGIDMVCVQVTQLTSSFQDVKPSGDGSNRLQIKYTTGGGFTIKNVSGATAYHSLVIVGLKKVN